MLPESNPNLYLENKPRSLELARIAYLSDISIPQISLAYGIPKPTLVYYVHQKKKSWAKLKDRLFRDATNKVLKKNIDDCKKFVGLSVKHALREITTRFQEAERMSTEDLQKVISCAVDIDKLVRLNAGQATEIVSNLDTTRDGLVKRLQDLAQIDPYVDYTVKDKVTDVIQ